MKKLLVSLSMIFVMPSLAAEMQANLTEKYVAVISNEFCTLASSKDTPLYRSYIKDVVKNELVEEGCWYHVGEVIYLIFPPTETEPAASIGIEALKFYKFDI